MWYGLFLGLMRRVLLLVFLLLVPAAWAEESNDWVVEVEDPFGNPIQDCEITLTEPWTGAEISNPGKGMYQASATCDGYVVMWHPPVPSSETTIVLEGHPIIENLFSVSGAHTMQALGSDWVIDVDDGPVDAPSGIPLILIGVGGSEIRYNQASITIPNSTTTYEIQGNYSSNITVKAVHTGTGSVVPWQDQSITVGEYGGGWSARVFDKGMPIGNTTWPPTSQWLNEQLNSSAMNGFAKIEFKSSLLPNENITGLWNANHIFNTGLGLPFMPGVGAGIESQVNRFLQGDTSELNALIESINYYNGKHSLCCLIDDSEVVFTNLNIISNIDLSSGYWGWNESAEISAQRSSIDLLRLEVPFQNDIRQSTPLTIQTDGGWQYLSSPLNDWIDGEPNKFTLDRDKTSISGYYTITLGQNSAPVVSIDETTALPWENTSYNFNTVIEDAPLSNHTCEWNISGMTSNLEVNLSAFEKGTELPISVTCTDEGGLNGSYSTSLILDGGSPILNSTYQVFEIAPGYFELELEISDDHDDDLDVYWTSNKSDGWWYDGQILQTSFSANSNLNSVYDNITQRHEQRNQIEYWVAAEITDDVGHTTSGNWTVKLLDNNGPVIIAEVEIFDEEENWIKAPSVTRPGDKLRLNLTQSFDDHDSIDKIKFTINILGKTFTDLSWSEIQYWEIPELAVGYHEINVAGLDESGNLAGHTFGVATAPPISRDLEIIDIQSSKTNVEPGENQFWITVQNNGASTTEFIVCSDDVCVDSMVGPSSFSQTATAIVTMKVDLDWFETFSVELSYLDDSNQTVVKHSTSDYNSGIGFGGLELFIVVALGVLGIIWARSRNGPRF